MITSVYATQTLCVATPRPGKPEIAGRAQIIGERLQVRVGLAGSRLEAPLFCSWSLSDTSRSRAPTGSAVGHA